MTALAAGLRWDAFRRTHTSSLDTGFMPADVQTWVAALGDRLAIRLAAPPALRAAERDSVDGVSGVGAALASRAPPHLIPFTHPTHSPLASAGVFPTTRANAFSPRRSSACPSRHAL